MYKIQKNMLKQTVGCQYFMEYKMQCVCNEHTKAGRQDHIHIILHLSL